MDYSALVHNVYQETATQTLGGQVANYIPELARVKPDYFGLALHTIDDQAYAAGDANLKFSIQSIVKVLALAMVYKEMDEVLWQRVGVEPSGDDFNSLTLLEVENGIPRNPFINAGALVVCDIMVSHWEHPKDFALQTIRQLANTEDIDFDDAVAASELKTGYRNMALIALMKSFGNIKNNIHTVLDLYFHLCSIAMTCTQLARSFTVLANEGRDIETQHNFLAAQQTRRLNALMQTCGMYNESGDFAFYVGLPGKSGVGGGIATVYPRKFSAVAWSPALNAKGNSVRGWHVLERLTTQLGESIFL